MFRQGATFADSPWAIVNRAKEEVIGCVGYHPPANSNIPIADNEVEVSYWVARPFWNQGICTEAFH